MGIFNKNKTKLVLHSKFKGEAEVNTQKPKNMEDKKFIDYAKLQIASVSPYRIEWYYIVNEKNGQIIYDFSKS